MSVKTRGINFDTGFVSAGTTTREPFDADVVRREMQIIRDDLQCDAVRITGGIPERLEIAARHAADAGLDVWFCPFTNGLTRVELLELLADCAERAERVRASGADVVMFAGSEVSLFTSGFFPGETTAERLALLPDHARIREVLGDVRARIRDFLPRAVDVIRARFGGKVSYASLPFEGVDWSPFDIIATDAGYRSAATASAYASLIRTFVANGRTLGKPVAITEFGCKTYLGAANDSNGIHSLVTWSDDGRPERLVRNFDRDENEQANYLRELFDVFDAEGVDATFVYTLARYDLPHRHDPRLDLDRLSCGIVMVLEDASVIERRRYPDVPWEPKAAFDALAERFGRDRGG
jgi:hypothetical protein